MQNGTQLRKDLEGFQFNPAEPIYCARCPFCGLDIVMGVRKDNGHAAIAHSAHPDPQNPGRHMTACQGFQFLLTQADLLPRLERLGAKWQRVEF